MKVTEEGFLQMARRVKRLADECCGGKFVAVAGGRIRPRRPGEFRARGDRGIPRDGDEPLAAPLGGLSA